MNGTLEKCILRWAGGKTWFIKELHGFLPCTFNDYHEPFFGGGSVFLNLKPKGKSYLSDSNADLMSAYCQIRDDVDAVIHILRQFKNTEEQYYQIRGTRFHTLAEKAAQFIYLNRTSFNGIYRVNLNGVYNVPYGFKNYEQLFDFDRLRKISDLLKPAILSSGDFEVALEHVREGDLVFLDPPYTVSRNKNGFIKYNEKLFSWKDQIRLASFIEEVHNRGAYYILTNAKHDSVKELFGRLNDPISVSRPSVVGGTKAKRGTVEEYVFANTVKGGRSWE